jgi:serine/threonine-protein kinase
MQLAEGLILDGHYRLRQQLGRGGMGEVWEAEHTRLPKRFAIKFLLSLAHADSELLMRFRREAEIASRLAHPSIVQVTDFNTLPDGTAYIVMERLIGEDLRARVDRGALSLTEVRELIRQIASALQLAHSEGIIHRDLKPENIFLCREPDGGLRAKLLDFGISKLQGNLSATRDDRVFGTPGYMAPEQAMGKNSAIDARTDVFALASIVHELLTGQPTFVGDTLAELCGKVLFYEPPKLDTVLPQLPPRLAAAVAQALSKDSAQRQPDVRTFADAVLNDADAASASRAELAANAFSATVASDAVPIPSVAMHARERDERQAREATTGPGDAAEAPPATAQTPSEATAPASKRGPASTWAATAASALAIVMGGAWFVVQHETGGARSSQGAQARAPTTHEAPPAALPAPSANGQAQMAAALENQQPTATSAKQTTSPKTDSAGDTTGASAPRLRAHAASALASLSAASQSALTDADRAFEQGDTTNALRLARLSLRDGSNERAYILMAKIYCKKRDTGMLQAMLRNVGAAGKKQVRRECQAAGLSLP